MFSDNKIELERGRSFETEVYDDGGIGLEMTLDYDNGDEEIYQSVYFNLTEHELNCLINLLSRAKQQRSLRLRQLLKVR